MYITTHYYDNLGRQIQINSGNGTATDKVTYSLYYPNGQIQSTWGFGVMPYMNEYDDAGRLYKIHTYKVWASAGEAVTTHHYSPLRGWLESKEYNDGSLVLYKYTSAGRVKERTWARGVITNYGYNTLGELQTVAYSDGTPSVSYTYDRRGRQQSVTDAAGTLYYGLDDTGRVRIGKYLSSVPQSLNYLSGVIVTNTQVPTSLLTSSSKVTINGAVDTTSTWQVDYAYDHLWRVQDVIKGGVRAGYLYDNRFATVNKVNYYYTNGATPIANSVVTRNKYGSIDITAMYRGASTTMSGQIDKYTYTKDMYGRVTKTNVDHNKLSTWNYSYNNKNELVGSNRVMASGLQVPGSVFNYSYDDVGNRTSATFGGTSSILEVSPPAVSVSTYTQDTTNLNEYTKRTIPNTVDVTVTSTAPAVLMRLLESSTSTPSYVQADQYIPESSPYYFFYNHRFSFTSSLTSPAMGRMDILEAPGNQSLYDVYLPASPESFQYDLDGNLTADGMWFYEWDGENRLKSMTMRPPAAAAWMGNSGQWVRLEFAYDAMGRRISKKYLTTTSLPSQVADSISSFGTGTLVQWGEANWWKYVYEPGSWNVFCSYKCYTSSVGMHAEGDFLDKDRSYAWGPDLSGSIGGAGGIGGLAMTTDDYDDSIRTPTTSRPMIPAMDATGNVTFLMRYTPAMNGAAASLDQVADYEYGPFGEIRSMTGPQAVANPVRWSTKMTDAETGLVYYGYRYYSPSLGRWISRDPIGEGDGPNLYKYVGNRPNSEIDSDGRWRWYPNVGHFVDGKFGPDTTTGTASKDYSSFVVDFKANRAAFLSDQNECRGCQEIQFIQIAYTSYPLRYFGMTHQWFVDASNPPVYEYSSPGSPPTWIATMHDLPGIKINSSLLIHGEDILFLAESCAVCNKGQAKGDVYGCLQWGFRVRRRPTPESVSRWVWGASTNTGYSRVPGSSFTFDSIRMPYIVRMPTHEMQSLILDVHYGPYSE